MFHSYSFFVFPPKSPCLSDGDVRLCGLAAVALYLSPAALRGGNALQEAQVLQWLSVAEQELMPAVLSLVSSSPGAKAGFARSRQELQVYLDALNKILLTRTYLVGEGVTLADIAVCCVLLPAFQSVLDGAARSKVANVQRWFNTIVNQVAFNAVVGNVTMLEGKTSKN